MKLMTCEVVAIMLAFSCLATPTWGQFNSQWQGSQDRQQCITPENYRGFCVALTYCPQVTDVYRLRSSQVATQYVLALHRSCGTRNINRDPVVCCTRPTLREQIDLTDLTPTTTTTITEPATTSTTTSTTSTTTTTTTPAPTSSRTTRATPKIVESRSNSCLISPGMYGECIDIKSCPPILRELEGKKADPEIVRYVKASNLICGGIAQNVCCPTEIPRRLPTEHEGCGQPNLVSYRKIVGGNEAKTGAWPWIALLGYGDRSESSFRCGGTLITARHVVTAAHCILDSLSFVRLGEHDVTTDTETPHMDVNIVKKVAHPSYGRIKNGRCDIALLYLERNVQFTDLIQPICMPNSPDLRQKSYVDMTPIVAGWGNTQENGRRANILNELTIPVLENSVCESKYKELNLSFSADQFDKAVLCAGVLSGGKDSCQGDSGGPLMISETVGTELRFYLIGIVAYGFGCARANAPGIYTSTQYFMDWINDKVQETP